jgi:hypothetical protein
MILILSVASLAVGTGLTWAPDRFPTQKIGLETCSGLLLVAGLMLIGSGLPLFR